MLYFLSFLTSLSLHLCLLIQLKKTPVIPKDSRPKEETQSRVKIKIKKSLNKKKLVKNEKKKSQRNKKKISFADLGINGDVRIEPFSRGENTFYSNEGGSVTFNLHEQIKQGVFYPRVLGERGIQGYVRADIFINEKGKYIEERSRFSFKSNLLGVFVRRILRRTLKKPILMKKIKAGYYPATFHFHLTTGLKKLEVQPTQGGRMFFYTSLYGGDSKIDKVAKGTAEVLSSISNVLTLIKYLPSSRKKKKLFEDKYLEDLKKDKYWGKQ